MKLIRGKLEGDTVLTEDTELHGMIVGTTTVDGGSTLRLHGTVTGNLILEENSSVEMHGMVNGDVYNKGGHLAVFGTVNGRVVREGGQTSIDAQAVIRDGVS